MGSQFSGRRPPSLISVAKLEKTGRSSRFPTRFATRHAGRITPFPDLRDKYQVDEIVSQIGYLTGLFSFTHSLIKEAIPPSQSGGPRDDDTK